MEPARAASLRLEDVPVDLARPEIAAAAAELYPDGAAAAFPLCRQILSFELENAAGSLAVALGNVMAEELPGLYLGAEYKDLECTDSFIRPEFLITMMLNQLPLEHSFAAAVDSDEARGLVLELNVENLGEEVMAVCAGDLLVAGGRPPERPLFNPTSELCVLQPGSRLRLANITPRADVGRRVAAGGLACRARAVPLDMERRPRERSHGLLQGDGQRSEFAQRGAMACPRRWKVTVDVPAAVPGSAAARALPAKACRELARRARQALEVLESGGEDGAVHVRGNSSWSVEPLADGRTLGRLWLEGENYTLTQLLVDCANSLNPRLSFAGSVENGAEFRLAAFGGAEDVREQAFNVAKALVAQLEALHRQLRELV